MKNPDLDEHQQLIQESARRISEDHFKPNAAKADKNYDPPVENLKILAEHGFSGVFIPEEYGGAGLGNFEMTLIVEQIARCCANTAMLVSVSNGATTRMILHAGTDEQKSRYLPPLASGELYAAWSMSEPDAGSDVGNVQTKAVLEGDQYTVNGSKLWCSCAQIADIFLVVVRLTAEPGMKGLGALLIDRHTPGFTIGKHIDLIGLRATGMAPLHFDNCKVPASSLLLKAGEMRKLFKVFDADRVAGNPTICLGVAAAALNGAAAYLTERKQFGQALSNFQGLQWRLADMTIDLEAARALVYRAAKRIDAGTSTPLDAAVAKTYANEMAVRVTNMAMQLCGGFGLSEEFPFERYFRDVRGMSIGYGTTEVLRNQIASEIISGRCSV